MPQNKNLSAVRNNSLFYGVKDREFKLNFNTKDFIEVEDGGIIYQAGDLSDAIFLIIDGEVKLKITDSGSPIVLKKKSNEFFGEKETLDNLARKSSAVANKDSILYMIRKNDVISLIQKSNIVKANLLGEPKDRIIDEDVKTEIVFNEPMQKLSDLPFFRKKKDEPAKDDTGIIQTEAEPINPEPVNEDESLAGLEQDNSIKTADEFKEAENIVKEHEKKFENIDLPADEDINAFGNYSQSEGDALPEYNNEEFPEIINKEDRKDFYLEEEPEKEDSVQWDFAEDVISDFEPAAEVNPDKLPGIEIPSLFKTIGKIFSGLKAGEIFTTIPEAVCELLKAERGRLFLFDKEFNEFRSKESKDHDYSEIRVKFTNNFFSDSFNKKKVINITYPSSEELEKISSGADIQSLLIFPIKNQKGDVTGILELDNSSKEKFEEKDESILSILNPLIALALENADFIQNFVHSDRLISLNKISNFLIQDIKSPIVTIKQYSEHIKKQNINEEILPVLDMIEEQADTIMNLVQTTLRYSEGILISKPQTILFSTAMDSILALLAEYVESRGIKLFKKYDGDGLVDLDRKEFYQACYQIAKNACDAMPHGGNFYVIVKREEKTIRIEFKDTGLGIPDSIKDRIFEPFMSHGKEGRTGLGLAIAEKIVKEHKGKIWAESDLGEGSVIIIVLPAID
jgi:signal transduction histidine kinase